LKDKSLREKLAAMSLKQLVFICEAWWVFLKWDLLISFFSYKYWPIKFDKNETIIDGDAQLPQVLDIIRLSEKVGRHHLRKMNCLRRCLSQHQLLEKRRYPCELHIGVKITDDGVKAHSWLTYNNVLINDSKDIITEYSELETSANSKILSALRG
jgi:hypothetical protein